MTLRNIPLDSIDQSHLQRLIDEAVSEARDIDYKQDTYGNSDRDHAEYLADISSFANTAGGDIVIGMTEQAGIPTGFAPPQIDIDAEILRLENIARSALQPRVFGLAARGVALAGGGQVLVVRIPRSYIQPHRIVRQGRAGDLRFWARSSKGKYEPNVDELRALFTRAPQLADRVRDYRFDRIAKIVANDTPALLPDNRLLIMHVAPLSAFEGARGFQLDLQQHPQQMFTAFPPIGGQVSQVRINVDGALVLSNLQANGRTNRAYVQIFHNGIVEAVASQFLLGEGTAASPFRLTAIRTEATIVTSSHTYLQALQARDAAPPYVVLVSLIGVKGIPYSFAMDGGRTLFEDAAGVLDRDQFHFSEMIIEDVPFDRHEYAKLIRPLLDQTANAAGRGTSPSFDHAGRFTLRV
jgi:Putative DNA-binding domain